MSAGSYIPFFSFLFKRKVQFLQTSPNTMKPKTEIPYGLNRDAFIRIEGAFNFRTFGGYKSAISSNATTREGFVYRSGHLSGMTSLGWDKLQEMGISKIIDLTSPGEVESGNVYWNTGQNLDAP